MRTAGEVWGRGRPPGLSCQPSHLYQEYGFDNLFLLSEVKVNLVDFDIELTKNVLCLKKEFSCRNVLQLS
jgi:hypothetical protein